MRPLPLRRLVPAAAVLAAGLLAASTAPTLGGYSAKIANSTNTVGTAPYFRCADALAQDKGAALFQWPLTDTGGTAADISGRNATGAYQGTRAFDTAAPLACPRDSPERAWSLDGTSAYADYATQQTNPVVFTLEVWFRTTVASGKLINFGSQATGASGTFDRQLYVNKTGGITFGVYPGGAKTIASPSATSYADGRWHQAAAALSPAGMVLYVDGVKVAADSTVTSAQNANGYWRVGYDSQGSWPNQGTSAYFRGSLAYAAVYTSALSAQQIAAHWGAGSGT